METTHAALRSLGLTDYGARAYAALVALGPSTAPQVATAAPLPRTKAYSVLSELARREWIDAERGRPKLYRARPPRECFERERRRLGATLDAALPALEAMHTSPTTRFAGPLWVMNGARAVAERTLEMVRSSKRDVLLVASFPLPGDEKALLREMRAAMERGVAVRAVLPDPRAPFGVALAKAGVPIRVARFPPRLLAVDGRQALIVLPEGNGADVRAIWNPSAELLEIMAPALGGMWEMAAEGVA